MGSLPPITHVRIPREGSLEQLDGIEEVHAERSS